MLLVILISAFMFGGITLVPESAEANCYKCGVTGFQFDCLPLDSPGTGRIYCRANACGSCCMGTTTCQFSGVTCKEVGGEIICEENQETRCTP